MRSSHTLSWNEVARHLGKEHTRSCATIEKSRVEHPQAAGMRASVGLPVGQIGDWRMPYPNCHGLHVREFADHYTAHLDAANPNCDLPGHIALDTPAVGGGAALGALAGLILGESAGAMIVGALIGGAIGAAAEASKEQANCATKRSPKDQPV